MRRDAFVHYMTGVPAMDEHHWQMIEQMNEINNLVGINDRNALSLKVAMLRYELEAHFEEEERMMREIGFLFFRAHEEAHEALLTRMKRIADDVNAEKIGIYKNLMADLQHIFVDHIDHMDMQYKPYYEAYLKAKEK